MLCFILFFKQKTAYEMRISDWSSDVCSSDLRPNGMKIDHVLRKAAVLFDKRGYVETTMADLADNLGISKPTLYTIAKGKRQILEAIVETWMNRSEERGGGEEGVSTCRSRESPYD